MDAKNIEKLNQLISRTDMTGNEKVEWLVAFIENYQTSESNDWTFVMIEWLQATSKAPILMTEYLEKNYYPPIKKISEHGRIN